MIEDGLYRLIAADAGIAAIAGNRIHAATVPSKLARPKLTYQRIDTNRLMSNDGPTGCCTNLFQFNCIADDYATACTLANAVRLALDGYRGPAGNQTIKSARITDEADLPQALDAGKQIPIQVRRIDAKIVWQET